MAQEGVRFLMDRAAAAALVLTFGIAPTLARGRGHAMVVNVARAELPDRTITPGQVDARLTAADICSTGTRSRRQVTKPTIAKVLRDYDVPANLSYEYELDHLVPLALGGTNAAANIWPQPEKEAAAKDVLERRLQDLVCSGRLPLAQAQSEMADDWTAAYARYVGGR